MTLPASSFPRRAPWGRAPPYVRPFVVVGRHGVVFDDSTAQ